MENTIQPTLSRATANAREMFNFTLNQKVIWLKGKYDYYFMKHAYKENGIKFYDLMNPQGIMTERVRESEIISFY